MLQNTVEKGFRTGRISIPIGDGNITVEGNWTALDQENLETVESKAFTELHQRLSSPITKDLMQLLDSVANEVVATKHD